MNRQAVKTGVLAAIAAGGAAVAELFGGWDGFLIMLIAAMAVDYVTGMMVALVFKKSPKTETGAASSNAGLKGLMKKFAVLLLVLIAAQLDAAIGSQYVRDAVILFFIGNEGLSILENIGLMGVPYPAFLKNALEALKKKNDAGSGKEDKQDG